jgi:hypothetical protein
MWEIESNRHMTPHVAKFYKTREDQSIVFEDAKLNMVAESYAHDFNLKSRIPQKVVLRRMYRFDIILIEISLRWHSFQPLSLSSSTSALRWHLVRGGSRSQATQAHLPSRHSAFCL